MYINISNVIREATAENQTEFDSSKSKTQQASSN